MSSEFVFNCPFCGQHVRAFAEHVGSRMSCPRCQNQLSVPDPLDKDGSGGRLVAYKVFTDEEMMQIRIQDSRFGDLAMGLTHNKYWQFVLLAELLHHSLEPLRVVLVDEHHEQALALDPAPDHALYAGQLDAKVNEFYGLLYLLYDVMNNHIQPAWEQDSALEIIKAAQHTRAIMGRLEQFQLSVYALPMPEEYPFPLLQDLIKTWVPHCWQTMDALVRMLLEQRTQRRLQLHEQLLQVSFVPPSMAQYFIARAHLPQGAVAR